jgi:hypothetical protein
VAEVRKASQSRWDVSMNAIIRRLGTRYSEGFVDADRESPARATRSQSREAPRHRPTEVSVRIVSFRHQERESFGFVTGSSVIPADVVAGDGARTVIELIEEGLPARDRLSAASSRVPLGQIKYQLPV